MAGMMVIHRGGDSFGIVVRDHVIHVDQPYSAGGMDAGPTPVELFVASLAACATHYARRYLIEHGQPADGLDVAAEFAMSATAPARVSRISLRVHPPMRLAAGHLDGLLAAASGCTVHNSIHRPPRIDIDTYADVDADADVA